MWNWSAFKDAAIEKTFEKKKLVASTQDNFRYTCFFPYIKQLYSFYQGASTIDRKIRDTLNCCNGCVYRLKNLPKKNDNHIGCTCNTLVLNMLKTKPSKPKRSFIQAKRLLHYPPLSPEKSSQTLMEDIFFGNPRHKAQTSRTSYAPAWLLLSYILL